MGSSYRGTLQGHENKPRLVQPPDAENRTSGGVGALTGETPVRATTHTFNHSLRTFTED